MVLGTLLVGDGGDVQLLQDISPGSGQVHVPPASHHGSHVIIVQGGIWQADGPDIYKHRYEGLDVKRSQYDDLLSENRRGRHR